VNPATRLALAAALIAGTLAPGRGIQAAAAQAAADAPFTLTLSIAGEQRQFRPGEIIPLELTFRSDLPGRFAVDGRTYDRSGRLTIDTFRVEPVDGVTDPLLDYFATSAGFIRGGLSSGPARLDGQSYTVGRELNEWLRFDRPGVYTVTVRSDRALDLSRQPANGQSVVPVESNPVSFEILPPDPTWEITEIRRAVELLATGRGDDHGEGCRVLRFLGTPLAVREIVGRLERDRTCTSDYTAGLFIASDRRDVVRQLEEGLRRADQMITRQYLRTLAVLSIYADRPELRPAQTPDVMGGFPSERPLARQPALVAEAMARYADIAAASLPDKTGDARAVTLVELLEYARSTPAGTGIDAEALRAQLAVELDQLPAYWLRGLLDYQWPLMARPEILPALRRLADGSDEIADLALRRLYELDPGDGRARIIAQVRNPPRHATLRTLGVLPDRELPELDDALASNVESGLTDLPGGLLQRYASPSVVPRILSYLDDRIGRLACRPQSYALAYLLRVSPADGAALLERALALRETTGCYQSVLGDLAALLMTPELEAAALASLDDPHPRVVLGAVATLGLSDSPSARAPLRERFEQWHDTWSSRGDELRGNFVVMDAAAMLAAMQRQIESAYLAALGAGRGWWAGIPELEALRNLCVTDDCRRRGDGLIARAGSHVIDVQVLPTPAELRIRVGQYDLNSLDALGAKLAQYPPGTIFTTDLDALDAERAGRMAAAIAAIAAAAGQVVAP
jgi:hypothetical protein